MVTDATWLGPPRWWAAGRVRPAQLMVFHNTEGAPGPASAEAGHAYDTIRPDQVSTNVFADRDTRVREVHDVDTAFAALAYGNALGVHCEMCEHDQQIDHPTVDQAAQQAAYWHVSLGLPLVLLSPAEVRKAWTDRSIRGVCSHATITAAFGLGDHADPGIMFHLDRLSRFGPRVCGTPDTGG